MTSWGDGRDLRVWSGLGAGGLAWTQRHAELRAFAGGRPGDRALRELLALQSSDWAFLATEGSAGPYPLERADGPSGGVRRGAGRSRDEPGTAQSGALGLTRGLQIPATAPIHPSGRCV